MDEAKPELQPPTPMPTPNSAADAACADASLYGYAAKGGDNNFNLLRIVLATLVLFSHSFPLTSGSSLAEPFRGYVGMTPGTIAVDAFFIISGFLVTKSITTKPLGRFLLNRILRIYPGLIVCVLLTVTLLGLIFNHEHFLLYLQQDQTIDFLFFNSVAVNKILVDLPGVFTQNPYQDVVNGSLWTLPCEVNLYASLAILGAISALFRGGRKNALRILSALAAAAALFLYVQKYGLVFKERNIIRLAFLFYLGSLYFGARKHIILDKKVFVTAIILLLGAGLADKRAFLVAYVLTLPYLVFYLAYVPSGIIRKYKAVGDYSYGVYIYAFPVQQMTVAFFHFDNPLLLFIVAFPVTFLFAFASWHCIEKRLLGYKRPPQNSDCKGAKKIR